MCGLYGMAGKLAYNDKPMLRMMAILSTVRGEDSAGVVVVDARDEPSIIKTVGTSFDLFDTSAFDRLSLYDKRAIIGHTRKATVGKISKSTAHPFNYDHIYGVHNGTLNNWRSLPGDTLETDSMTLYSLISRVGLRDAVEQTEGAYALVFWDEREKQLNIVRNNQRTLYYAFDESGEKLFWASEGWIITIAAARTGTKLMDLTPKDEETTLVASVETDTWWKIRLDGGAKPLTFLKDEELKGGVKKPEVRPFNYRAPFDWESRRQPQAPKALLPNPVGATSTPAAASSTTTTTGSSQVTGSTSKDTQSQKPILSLVPGSRNAGSEQSSAEKLDDSPFDNEVKGFNDRPLDRAEFEKTDCKCSFCQRDVTFEDALAGGIWEWIDRTSFVCTTCTNEAK